MSKKTIIAYIVTVLSFNCFSQETVYLEAGEFGRGVLKERSGQCFVIAPFHVIGEDSEEVLITGDRMVISNGVFTKGFSSDLAVVRISGGGEQFCTSWSVSKDFNLILDNAYEGYIEKRNNNGTASVIQVYLSEKTDASIVVKPKSDKIKFSKGMSGSSLFTLFQGEKVYLGMLQLIKQEKGYVLQADDIDRVLYDFFNPKKGNSNEIISDEDVSKEIQQLLNRVMFDLAFVNEHFKNLRNNKSNVLAIEFDEFIKNRINTYSQLSENSLLNAKTKLQYNGYIKEIKSLLTECKTIIDNEPHLWDVNGAPKVSMIAYQLDELKYLLENK